MIPQMLRGAGYIVPLAALLVCLGGVLVAEVVGVSLVTMARVGATSVFSLVVIGWGIYKIDQYRSIGKREERIRSYLKDEEYLDDE